MPLKTITKIFLFVILISAVSISTHGCGNTDNVSERDSNLSNHRITERIGTIASEKIQESSGLTSSKCHEEVLWTHNDSGNSAELFAISPDGSLLGIHNFTGLVNRDWEAIASYKSTNGKCFLYIGDIGNNTQSKQEHIIYRVEEPTVYANLDSLSSNTSETSEYILFTYPDGYHDSETLLVHPASRDIYIITKSLENPAFVYKFSDPIFDGRKVALEKVGILKLPSIPYGAVTDGDISPNGKRVFLVDYFGGFEYVLADDATDFDNIWQQQPIKYDAGQRSQGESAAYSLDGKFVYTTSEGSNSPVYRIFIYND